MGTAGDFTILSAQHSPPPSPFSSTQDGHYLKKEKLMHTLGSMVIQFNTRTKVIFVSWCNAFFIDFNWNTKLGLYSMKDDKLLTGVIPTKVELLPAEPCPAKEVEDKAATLFMSPMNDVNATNRRRSGKRSSSPISVDVRASLPPCILYLFYL